MTKSIKKFADITVSAISENAILLTWPEKVCPEQHQTILAVQQMLKLQLTDALVDTVASYHSLILYYHFEQISAKQILRKINDCISSVDKHSDINSNSKSIEIPVCYHPSIALDLEDVCQQTGLTAKQVKALHQQTYTAYALGFTPGFCYLATLDKQLQLTRKQTPRLKMPVGAVAIAEQQTAIYPNESPGGWHIIGQTPIAMYSEVNGTFKPLISVGDKVSFTEISLSQFNQYKSSQN